MRFTKAKIVAAGMILAGICMIAPQQLRAEVPKTQMDGVMGQSIKEEMDDTQISDVDTQRDGLLSTYAMPRLLGASKASSGYTQDFLDGSFTSKVDYTSVTYYHKSDYEDAQLLNGIDVSWWQAKNKKTTALNWEKIHDAGIDFAFVRVASRDTSDGSIYEDTAADSHIQAALENDINVGLYIFSQALTEKEAKQEAEYVLDLADKYGWDVTLPIVIDREKGSHNRLTGGKLSKAKETAVCQSSSANLSVTRPAVNSMLDCPEQSQTSPTRISFNRISFTVISKGPPAFMGGSSTSHLPSSPATVLNFFFLKTTVTFSPLSAFPHILTGRSRCNTIPSDRMAGNFTFASVHAENAQRTDITKANLYFIFLIKLKTVIYLLNPLSGHS